MEYAFTVDKQPHMVTAYAPNGATLLLEFGYPYAKVAWKTEDICSIVPEEAANLVIMHHEGILSAIRLLDGEVVSVSAAAGQRHYCNMDTANTRKGSTP